MKSTETIHLTALNFFQVVLINVVHLRDPVCPLPTSVLAQYLKQASGQLSCLKVNSTFIEKSFLKYCRFKQFPTVLCLKSRFQYRYLYETREELFVTSTY